MPRQRIGADPMSPAERQARTSSEAARAQPSLVDTSRAGATQGSPRATSGETPVANRTVGDGSGDARRSARAIPRLVRQPRPSPGQACMGLWLSRATLVATITAW